MFIKKKSIIATAFSILLLFSSCPQVMAMQTKVAPQTTQPVVTNLKNGKKLTWKQKIRKKFKKFGESIAEFVDEHPLATIASVIGGIVAIWYFSRGNGYTPWIHREAVIGRSACDVQEVTLPAAHEHVIVVPQEEAREEEARVRMQEIRFRTNNPVHIIQLRCADQAGPECGYQAAKNCMVILNHLNDPQLDDLQLQLEGNDLCNQLFGAQGAWRRQVMNARQARANANAQFAPQLARRNQINVLLRGHNLRIQEIDAQLEHEVRQAQPDQAALDRLRQERNQIIAAQPALEDERRVLNAQVVQRNDAGIPLGECDQNGNWLRGEALRLIMELEHRPQDENPRLLVDQNTPITIIDNLPVIGNPQNINVPALDPTLEARQGLARAGAYRHAFILSTARPVINERGMAVVGRNGGHYVSVVLDRNEQGEIRWYVANSMNWSILGNNIIGDQESAYAVRCLIAAVQGQQV